MAQQKASGNYSNPYLFNGKELDEETGLYYYGARYYNPRYSLWLGVDAMVEKHADFTPFAFCYNNPIILVDPYGMDTILFNTNGEFGDPIKSGDINDVYIKVNRNEFKENKIDYKKGNLLRARHKNMEINKEFRASESYNKEYDTHSYNISDYSTAKEVFEFFADNTKVEWGHLILSDLSSGNISNTISTSHLREIIWMDISNTGTIGRSKILEARHSHVNSLYSGSDDRTYFRALNEGERDVMMLRYFKGRYYPIGPSPNTRYENFPIIPKSF